MILSSQMTTARRSVTDLTLSVSKMSLRDDRREDIMWTPYPRSNRIGYSQKPALLKFVMAEMVRLTEILVEIQGFIFHAAYLMEVDQAWARANDFHRRLQLWYDNLPDVLGINDCPVPQVLFIRYGLPVQYDSRYLDRLQLMTVLVCIIIGWF
jgi:hypothetical protein